MMLTGKEYDAWLLTLKAGDKVAFYKSTWGLNEYRIKTIDKVTDTQIVIGEDRYHRTGARAGDLRGDAYSPRISPIDEERIAKIDLEMWRRTLIDKIRTRFNWDKLTDDQLKAVEAVMNETPSQPGN